MRRKESPDLMMVTLETGDFYPKINGKELSLHVTKLHGESLFFFKTRQRCSIAEST